MTKVSLFLEVIRNNTTTNVPDFEDVQIQKVVTLLFEETLVILHCKCKFIVCVLGWFSCNVVV